MATDTPVYARVDGDWLLCGGCDTRIALGLAALKVGARLKCPRCKAWVNVEVRAVSE